MKHFIDPKIDCVFKALLGSEENRNLLIHFLNAILAQELAAPIVAAELHNPHNEREHADDKLTIVDVKAKDEMGRWYQVEIQLLSFSNLPARILYTWADLYSQQLQSGQDYAKLKPTYSIWLLADNLFRDDDDVCRAFKLRDAQGRTLIEHGGIWLLELNKYHAQAVKNEQQRWIRFFKEGDQLNDAALPDWMATTEMRQAMSTLSRFSEKEADYLTYQNRQNFLRQQRTIQRELEEERQGRLEEQRGRLEEQRGRLEEQRGRLEEQQAKVAAQEREQIALIEKQAALAEVARLQELLNQKNQ